MYLVAILPSFFARSVTQMTHSMNFCLAMQRCMQGCYVCLIVPCAARIPRQYQHLQTAASCVSAPRGDSRDKVESQCPCVTEEAVFENYSGCIQVQTHRWSSCGKLQCYGSLLARLDGWAMPRRTACSTLLWLQSGRKSWSRSKYSV